MMLGLIFQIVVVIPCILYCNCKKAVTPSNSWSHIANILREESKANQVLLLLEHKSSNQEILKIEKEFLSRIPTRVANFENDTEEHRQKILQPEHRFQTTTVVVILSQNDYRNSSKLSKILISVAILSKPEQLPKVLIISQVTNRIKYEKFLNYLWSKMFLDVTILERQLEDGCKQLFAESIEKETLTRHYYNPFNRRFYRNTFFANSRLFPNKLNDMKGYKMSVFYFHFPPYVFYKRNSSGHVVDVYGSDTNLVNTYSKVMNFTIKKELNDIKSWLKGNCDEDFYLKQYGDIDLLGIQSGGIQPCWRKFILTSKGTRIINFVMLVPIVSDEMKIETEWNFKQLVIVVGLMIMPWLLSRFLKFERRYWKFMYTIAMLLGFTTPQEPRRNAERLFYILLWAFYFLQTSFIFTTLSSLQMRKVTFKKMETLDDVIDANLTLIVHGYMQSHSENFQKLMRNGKFSEEPLEKCAEMLINYQNVTCYGREDVARSIIGNNRVANKESRLKILEGLYYGVQSILFLKKGSPYKRRFEFITSVLIESGISNMWDASYIPKESSLHNQADSFKQESLLSSNALFLMIYCFLVGCLCSSLTFAAEIIIHKYLKKITQ